MKRIVILGSSGSIGQQSVDVALRYPDLFKIIGIAVNTSADIAIKQAHEFRPNYVAIADEEIARIAGPALPDGTELITGLDCLEELACLPEADIVLNALVGSIGLKSTLSTIKAGKTLALANKESMVAGGAIVVAEQRKSGSIILPVDSEHNAIFQCLVGEKREDIIRILLTASGGPFRGLTKDDMKAVSVEQALDHPRWNMGPKITIDSATMMNKGLEVIEARWLFDIQPENINVVIHPQSIIHSMVEFSDGSIKAHLGQTDMRIPIQYALSYPERLSSPLPSLNFAELGSFTFHEPDVETFPCLQYAYNALKLGGSYPAALNAANEEAVAAFLDKRISFTDIAPIIYEIMQKHKPVDDTDLDGILKVEEEARALACEAILKIQM